MSRLGWAMQVAAFIFLDRHWETDQDHIDNILKYFVELESKPNILFFPEGIIYCDITIELFTNKIYFNIYILMCFSFSNRFFRGVFQKMCFLIILM